MIGWINLSVKAFICDTFGADAWAKVLAESGEREEWISSCPYSDGVTYNLVLTAAKILGVTPNQALEAYGRYFVKYVKAQGYTKLLKCLGSNLAEFLQNLNDLHLHLSMSYSAMKAPAFRCENVTAESLHLHYHSARQGLWPITVGVLHSMSQEFWGFDIQVELIRSRDQGDSHEVFLVRYPYQEELKVWSEHAVPGHVRFTMSRELFYELAPFHMLLDTGMRILQCGPVLARMYPSLAPGSHISDTFQLRHPYVALDFALISGEHLNNSFLLKAHSNGLELKGQMTVTRVPHAHGCPAMQEAMLFMGSPRIANLDELQQYGLYLSDIPLHHMSRDFVLLAEQRQAEAELKERFEKLTMELRETNARLAETTRNLEVEKLRSDQLLYQMLPREIANCLRQGQRVDAVEYPDVTILFSDIVGFTDIASRCTPMEICNMLDDLYNRFDSLLEEHPSLYKVETIGDAYMLVGNCTSPCEEHVDMVLDFALQMQAQAKQVRSVSGQQIRIRVGIHSGPVVGGVVGKRMPRFCLFGDTVNTASRMESHGVPGKIHISRSSYSLIRCKDKYAIRERGMINVKGKGPMQTYLINSYGDGLEASMQASGAEGDACDSPLQGPGGDGGHLSGVRKTSSFYLRKSAAMVEAAQGQQQQQQQVVQQQEQAPSSSSASVVGMYGAAAEALSTSGQ